MLGVERRDPLQLRREEGGGLHAPPHYDRLVDGVAGLIQNVVLAITVASVTLVGRVFGVAM
jgi:hypothetical protein